MMIQSLESPWGWIAAARLEEVAGKASITLHFENLHQYRVRTTVYYSTVQWLYIVYTPDTWK